MAKSIIDDLIEKQPDLDRESVIFRYCPFNYGYNPPLCDECQDDEERSLMEICGECWNSPVENNGSERG